MKEQIINQFLEECEQEAHSMGFGSVHEAVLAMRQDVVAKERSPKMDGEEALEA